MGSEIDQISPRSYPNYFEHSSDQIEKEYHQNRLILSQIMLLTGFQQHPNEWWHFSLGDQLWAWLINQQNPEENHDRKIRSIFLLILEKIRILSFEFLLNLTRLCD